MENKNAPKLTGRSYSSVEELIAGEKVSPEVQKHFSAIEKETRISRRLALMRSSAGLTQAQMAEKIGCSQSCISKWESEEDQNLTLGTISEYCRILGQRVGIALGKPLNHVEAVKAHAWGLRNSLSALAALAKDDDEVEQGVKAFFGEAFFNLLNIFEHCQQELPNGGDFEIRMEVHENRPFRPSLLSSSC